MKALPLALALTVSFGLAAACSDSESRSHGTSEAGAGGETSSDAGGADATPAAGGDGLAAAGAGATGTAGADGSEAGAGGAFATPPMDSTEFCDAFAKTLCSFAEDCQKFPACEEWGGYQNYVRECVDARASETAGYVEFQPQVAAECLSVASAETCAAGGPLFNHPSVRSACSGVFAGTVEPDGECASADFAAVFDECADGYCHRPGGICLGSCVPYVPEDGDCSAGQVCELGLFCNGGTCGPPSGLGEDCASATCEPGLICGSAPATCRMQGPAGADCVDRYDCQYPAGCLNDQCSLELDVADVCLTDESCKDGLFCKFGNQGGVCAAKLAAAATCDPNLDQCVDGYACSYVEPHKCVTALGGAEEPCGPRGCEAGLWCEPSGPFVGTCHTIQGLDGACTSGAGCEEGLYCVGSPGKCAMPGGAGAACAAFDDASCIGDLFCARDTLKCTAPRAKGQTCNPSEPLGSCQAGLYCACLNALCPTISSGHNTDDVCVAQLADDADCNAAYECSSGNCASLKCTSQPAAVVNCTR